MMEILLFVVWYLIGVVGTIYWLCKVSDIIVSDLFPIVLISIGGPLSFIVGLFVYSDKTFMKKVLIKKR